MSYLSSNDARRQNSTAEVDGFSTSAEELFLCTCHGKRWPLSMLKIENGGQRHCPNQTNAQGGSIDRDMLRDYDRVELERRAVDDAAAVQWPISPLENIPCVASIDPPQQTVRPSTGGPLSDPTTAQVRVLGVNLSAADTIELTFDGAPEVFLPPLPLAFLSASYAVDGSSVTISVQVNGPAFNVNLVYNGSEYDNVFLVR